MVSGPFGSGRAAAASFGFGGAFGGEAAFFGTRKIAASTSAPTVAAAAPMVAVSAERRSISTCAIHADCSRAS